MDEETKVHPLATRDRLAKAYKRRRQMTTRELAALLEREQFAIDAKWKRRVVLVDRYNCDFPGCNHHRYPASQFCLYHAVGHDVFASRLRAAIKRDKARGVEVSKFDGIWRLITENIPKRP